MASIGHVAVGWACARLHQGKLSAKGLLFFSALALLPDADVIGFTFDVPYGAPWGHRGATHSLAFALGCGLLAWIVSRKLWTASWVFVAVASHPLLDALTDGGKGVALLWPWMNERFFFPWRPLPVAPIGMGMFSWRGAQVLLAEFILFLPFWAIALLKPSNGITDRMRK